MKLGDLQVYRISLELSDVGWSIYNALPTSLRFHMGDQLLRSIDSISANIAEGFGRYHYLDSVRFYYNARGSLFESKDWIRKMKKRNLITDERAKEALQKLEKLCVMLNNLISTTRKQKK